MGSVATNNPTLPMWSGTAMAGSVRTASVAFVVVGSVGDPDGTRTVSSIIALLVALGLALVMVAVWLHRVTRPDPELLAPLEVMGEHKWRRADPVWQRRRLDEIRPRGAVPMQPSIAPPAIDKAFDEGPSATGFDDFHGVGISSEETAGGIVPRSASGRGVETDTPPGLKRPSSDEFPDGEVDPDILAAAMAQLDAELDVGLGHDRP